MLVKRVSTQSESCHDSLVPLAQVIPLLLCVCKEVGRLKVKVVEFFEKKTLDRCNVHLSKSY